MGSLNIAIGASGLQISWPAKGGTLQQNTNLAAGTAWVPSTHNVTTSNGTNTVTLTPPGTENLFSRLVGP